MRMGLSCAESCWSPAPELAQRNLEDHGYRERRLMKGLQGWGHIPSLKRG